MANTVRGIRSCEVCATEYRPTYYEQRTCGRSCGAVLRFGAPKSDIEWRHCEPCATWYTRQAGGHRHKPIKDTSWMTKVIECPMCGEGFTNPHTTIAVHCTLRCSRKANKLRRRVREAGTFGEWRWSDFMRMAARFDYCCAYCGEKPDRLDPDHVLPLSRGGPNVLANLLPACSLCNADKNAKTLPEWEAWRVERRKPPRRTSWAPEDRRYWHLTYGISHEAAA